MEQLFNPLKILREIDLDFIEGLTKKQLKILLLLIVCARENNGNGKVNFKTIENFAGECVCGEDLFAVCRIIKKSGWGELTCCKGESAECAVFLCKDMHSMNIEVKFWDFWDDTKKRKNGKT